MKKNMFYCLLIILSILLISFLPRSYEPLAIEQPINPSAIRVMTYNIKNSYQDKDQWHNRKEALVNEILRIKPDTIGLQEADDDWITYLKEELDDYDLVGHGRDYNQTGEHTAIFYLKDDFELIETETLWLSETPDLYSVGWDGACPRILTRVTLKDKSSGTLFTHFNTHLDHKGKLARSEAVKQILNLIDQEDRPVILTGDFNVLEGSSVYDQVLAGTLIDSKHVAADTTSFGTMNYFTNYHFRLMPPIDFIFISQNDFEVDRYQVVYETKHDNQPLSDHFPVFVDLLIK